MDAVVGRGTCCGRRHLRPAPGAPAPTLSTPRTPHQRPWAASPGDHVTGPCADPMPAGWSRDDLREQVGQLLMVASVDRASAPTSGGCLAEIRAGSVDPAGQLHRRRRSTRQVVADIAPRAAGRKGSRRCSRSTRRWAGAAAARPGFTEIPTAQTPGRAVRQQRPRTRRAGGRDLAAAGIANLAPVADVVPADLGTGATPRSVGSPGYGSSPRACRPQSQRIHDGDGPSRHSHGGQALPGPGSGSVATPTSPAGWSTPDHPSDPELAGFAADDRRRSRHGDGLLGLHQDRRRARGPPSHRWWISATCCGTIWFAGVVDLRRPSRRVAMADL